MKKLDFTQAYPTYYNAAEKPNLVSLKPSNYLSIQGVSSPESKIFAEAISAIYAVAYGIKFHCKAEGQDFVVPKMEAQWWVEADTPFEQTPRDQWHWNVLIPMPEFVDQNLWEMVVSKVSQKKKELPIDLVKLSLVNEGNSVQILHHGSYDDEGPTLEKIFAYLDEQGLEINGHHHEIYLNDPMKTEASRLKTIIRYPVR